MVDQTQFIGVRPRRVSAIASPLLCSIVAVTMFLAPFNGGAGFPGLGEIGRDPFFTLPLFATPIIFLEVQLGRFEFRDRTAKSFFLGMLTVLCIGLLVNIRDIISASLIDRHGFEKFVSSAMVLLFGIYVAMLMAIVGRVDFRRFILRPIQYSGMVVIAVGLLEYGSWHNGALAAIYRPILQIAHFGTHTGDVAGIGGRIQSVTYEPSFFGAFISFSLPWLIVGIIQTPKLPGKLLYFSFVAAGVGEAMLSGRTSQVGVPITIALFVYLWLAVQSRRKFFTIHLLVTAIAFLLLTCGPLYMIVFEGPTVVNEVLATYSTSNTSRFATAYICAQLFAENPIFGIGMGQYGFNVPSHIPGWAYNFEFKRWLDGTGSFFPTFSTIARIAGELGALGLVFWCGMFVHLIRAAMRCAFEVRARMHRAPIMGISVVVNLFGSSLYGWSAGSFRAEAIWAAVGVASAYLCASRDIEARSPAF